MLIKPSKAAVKKRMRQIADKVGKVINILNPIIIGKANYWRPMVSKDTFSKMDFRIYKVN